MPWHHTSGPMSSVWISTDQKLKDTNHTVIMAFLFSSLNTFRAEHTVSKPSEERWFVFLRPNFFRSLSCKKLQNHVDLKRNGYLPCKTVLVCSAAGYAHSRLYSLHGRDALYVQGLCTLLQCHTPLDSKTEYERTSMSKKVVHIKSAYCLKLLCICYLPVVLFQVFLESDLKRLENFWGEEVDSTVDACTYKSLWLLNIMQNLKQPVLMKNINSQIK